MKMPTIRRMWAFYKRDVLREVGVTRRDEVQVLTQNAFYFGAYSTLQALATLLEDGDVEQVHDVIERHGRQLKKIARPFAAGAAAALRSRDMASGISLIWSSPSESSRAFTSLGQSSLNGAALESKIFKQTCLLAHRPEAPKLLDEKVLEAP